MSRRTSRVLLGRPLMAGVAVVAGLLAVPERSAAEPPVISYAADGVPGNETLLLCGDGFDQPGLEVLRWLPPQPKREEWPDEKLQHASLERAFAGEAKWPAQPDGRPAKLTVSDITRHTSGARLQFWPMRRPDPATDDAGPLVFNNTVRECMWGDAPRLPHQNQWYPFWEQKHFHPDPSAPLPNHIAIGLAVKGSTVGDPDDVKWDTLTPAATANIIERNFVDFGWPVGIYETRSARGNIITNDHLAAKQPLVRRSEMKATQEQP